MRVLQMAPMKIQLCDFQVKTAKGKLLKIVKFFMFECALHVCLFVCVCLSIKFLLLLEWVTFAAGHYYECCVIWNSMLPTSVRLIWLYPVQHLIVLGAY